MKTTLRTLRQEHGLTQQQVADMLHISRQAVASYETGIRNISLDLVLTLATLYEITAEEVILAQINSRQSNQ